MQDEMIKLVPTDYFMKRFTFYHNFTVKIRLLTSLMGNSGLFLYTSSIEVFLFFSYSKHGVQYFCLTVHIFQNLPKLFHEEADFVDGVSAHFISDAVESFAALETNR
ncbi:hypothetical protein ACJX0J_016245 [Zea mays]